MEPNWQIIGEILITLRINNNCYVIKSDNFPQYDSEELILNLQFLTDIGLVNTRPNMCRSQSDIVQHKLTFDGERITDKLMDGYYEKLM